MHSPHPDLTHSVIHGLGWLYTLLFLANVGWTLRSFKRDGDYESVLGFQHIPRATVWAFYTAFLMLMAVAHLTANSAPEDFLIRLPNWLKAPVDLVFSDARKYFGLMMLAFVGMIWKREFLSRDTVGWVMFNAACLFLGFSMTDYDFRQIVGKPDNVPIVGMLFLCGYFTWLFFKKACDNDRRLAEGRPLAESELSEQVLVWPDLVYTEMLCMILLSAVLIVWGVVLQAPLEEPGSAVKTPNPSKAPWYFLGLQEMLVYFDPWLAGVVLPLVILQGLMAIPYIDFNKKGNGYYCFNDRKFSVIIFLVGFLPLWIGMIVLGTFVRGPNWNMFGLYEFWDVHKLEVLNNVNLSEYVWVRGLGMPLPAVDSNGGVIDQLISIFMREGVGIVLIVGYFMALPHAMALTFLRKFYIRMGVIRYMVLANLLLFMALLPIKMVLRWAFSLKYIVAIPEWFFNI